jgi:hypothetical protein
LAPGSTTDLDKFGFFLSVATTISLSGGAAVTLSGASNTASGAAWRPVPDTLTAKHRFDRFKFSAVGQAGILSSGILTLHRVADVVYELVALMEDMPRGSTNGCMQATVKGPKGGAPMAAGWGRFAG